MDGRQQTCVMPTPPLGLLKIQPVNEGVSGAPIVYRHTDTRIYTVVGTVVWQYTYVFDGYIV